MVIEPVEFNSKTRMTDIGEVPTDWEVKSIKEVATVVSGGTPSKSNSSYWENGSIAWATPTDITKNKKKYISNTELKITETGLKGSSANLLPINSILMTSRATIGASSIAKIPIATNQGFKSFICKENLWYEYLYYYLEILKPYFIANASGSTFLEISKGATENQLIAVPPLKEQQKIAEILSAADEQIEITEKLIQKTKELKKGLMQQLLTKGLGHTQFKSSDLGEIPNEWDVVQFKDICTRIIVGIASSTSQYYTTEKAVPILRNQNIKENKIRTKDVLYITKEFDETNYKKRLRKGDLLTVRTGYPGLTAVVPSEFEEAQSFTTLISSPNPVLANSHYLAYYMNSEIGKKDLTGLSAGGAQQNLNVGSLSTFKLKLPPLAEQSKIVDILFSIDNQIEVYEKEKEKELEMKRALMQQLLTGKIRVTV